ncbi:tRNA (guanosine(46)-N7)-methyltransferase TrmB [Thalassobacillus sp. CUG 92003]|uniref:tRNA (guanosine(46)-N7)-methyltransferase TrmB n=1 Tax=Thalassobacillus sp. CUG 92003 TaxID=2736641 RepID=UPI0015E6F89B|nr:tRNA (guanosine(46)-N7)-methyltransferase TrmB [Thalassobacillus sp. CUG 92003]
MRLRHKPWADQYMKDNNHILIQEPFEQKGCWKQLFDQQERPLHLEVGTGKGQFIAGMGEQHSEVNFVGIERVKSVIVGALKKVKAKETTNTRLAYVDAEDLRDLFVENEIDHIYLNFSDPWPKNRHEKRRLTYPTFLEQYQHILKDEGEITLKTDNLTFFEYSLVSFSKFGMTLQEVNLDLHETGDETNVPTEYEEKFSQKGQPIYRCRASFSK